MNFEEYVEQAVKFAPDIGPSARICQSILGLIGEVGELKRASDTDEFLDEYGDCWWYIALGVWAMRCIRLDYFDESTSGYFFTPIDNQYSYRSGLRELAANEVEKFYFQERSPDWSVIAAAIVDTANWLNCQHPSNSEIWKQNIEKLEDRHA